MLRAGVVGLPTDFGERGLAPAEGSAAGPVRALPQGREVRDEPGVERAVLAVARAVPDVTLLLLGAKESERAGDPAALVLALALVVLAALAGRAGPERVRVLWWGSGPAYLAIVLVATLAGSPAIGPRKPWTWCSTWRKGRACSSNASTSRATPAPRTR